MMPEIMMGIRGRSQVTAGGFDAFAGALDADHEVSGLDGLFFVHTPEEFHEGVCHRDGSELVVHGAALPASDRDAPVLERDILPAEIPRLVQATSGIGEQLDEVGSFLRPSLAAETTV